jgi:hypothetical protein
MRGFIVLLTAVTVIGASAGCAAKSTTSPGTATPAGAAGGTAQNAGPTSSGPASSSPATGTSGAKAGEHGGTGGKYRVTYDWAVPSIEVTVQHVVDSPLPYLLEIHTGDHGGERPGYARITFTFGGGFPEYRFQYVAAVRTEGAGQPIQLDGNAFLRIQFVYAQAHDSAGRPTLRYAASPQVGLGNLRSYGSAGDFEGYVSYGLGLRAAPNSDQVLPVRTGELAKVDGKGGSTYTIAFDVRSG